MQIDFTGRNVLVTGGTRGIGRGIVEAFLEAGARVAVNGSSRESTDKALGEQIQGIPFSVKQIVLPRNSHKSGHEHLTMPKGTMQLTFENRDHGPIEHGPVDDIRVRDQGVGNRGHDTCHRQRVPCKPPNLCPCSGMGVGRLRSRVRRTGVRRQIKTVSTHAR